MLAGLVCHASLFCTSCLFLAFFPTVAWFSLGCSDRMLSFSVLWEGEIMAQGPSQKAEWSSSVGQQFRSSCMNMICGCSGTYQSNAKCCSVLVGLFVMPFSKHKQIDCLAPAAAYDIYTTCMIQRASLGKQACVLCIFSAFSNGILPRGEHAAERMECSSCTSPLESLFILIIFL